MKLDKNWTLEPDIGGKCWVLTNTEKRIAKVGKSKGKMISVVEEVYPANMKQGLVMYLDEVLKPSEGLQDVLNRIREVEKLIEKLQLDVRK